ncbi:Xaa-Pro dipeptidyl-peptidase [Streptomyces xylophagus]|uniref:Xaa-Pro dipeptidyl-peptidase n=1 Tax=Streptomyces xylophagus TaxID=285514 RepID=UPI000691EFF1|nr:Xaa-Pro dipeptidyl-peptidase [Streptomyces xylophagus]
MSALLATAVAALLTGCSSSPNPSVSQAAGRTSTTAGASRSPAGPSGESKPVYSYKKAVRETVWVDTGRDDDRDGKDDRLAVDIVRPGEPAAKGRKIPVIMEASPYYSCCGRGNENQKKTYDAKGQPVRFPLFYDNYFVPRGYAFVAVDLPGTGRSDGCTDAGGPIDVQSTKAVVDWLNGRAHAYTTHTGTTPARATWTNGNTGMIGKSWDGSIANGVAATGVRGLKTIVPISSISSWYDAYFSQGAGLVGNAPTPGALIRMVESEAAGARCAAVNKPLGTGAVKSGDWSPIWAERDYVADAKKVKASVLVVHGLQDLTVRTKEFGEWWDALAKNGVERKIWLSQTGHVDPFDYRRAQWVDTLHHWFDHALLGYDNGIDRAPMADIERTPDHWTTDAVWPPKSTTPVTLNPVQGTKAGVGTLGTQPGSGTETFTDATEKSETDWATHIGQSTGEKAGFVTEPLTKPLRVSGASKVTVTATSTTATANLSAVLVDLGPATIRGYDPAAGLGISTLSGKSCWGENSAQDSACYKKTAAHTTHVTSTVFSRGWAALGTAADAHRVQPLTPGKPYTLTLTLASVDHIVPAGHRLALIVAGTDWGIAEQAADRPTITLDLAHTSLRLPVVGHAGLPST